MNNNILKLSDIPIGVKAKIIKILSKGLSKQRLLDLGMVKGSTIYVLIKSMWGDPTVYLIKGTCIALRDEETNNIEVISCH